MDVAPAEARRAPPGPVMLHSFSVLRPPKGPSLPRKAASAEMARCESMPLKCLPTAKPSVSTATRAVPSSLARVSTTDGWTPVRGGRLLGRVGLELLREEREGRRHLDLAVPLEPELEAAGQGRVELPVDVLQPQGLHRRALAAGQRARLAASPGPSRGRPRATSTRRRRSARPRPRSKRGSARSTSWSRTSSRVSVRTSSGRSVKLLEEGLAVAPLLQEAVDDGEREVAVVAGLHRDPQVGVDRGGVELRRDDDDLAAAVLGLPEVVGVRDAGGVGVAAPEERHVGAVDEVVGAAQVPLAVDRPHAREHVAHVAGDVGAHRAEQRAEPLHRGGPRLGEHAGAHVDVVPGRPLLPHGLVELGGHLGDGLVPGDALPLALAAGAGAPHRVEEPVGAVHDLRVLHALVAAARVGVRHVGRDGRVAGRLVLAGHLARGVGPDLPGAVPLAVDAVVGVAVLLAVAVGGGELVPVGGLGARGLGGRRGWAAAAAGASAATPRCATPTPRAPSPFSRFLRPNAMWSP